VAFIPGLKARLDGAAAPVPPGLSAYHSCKLGKKQNEFRQVCSSTKHGFPDTDAEMLRKLTIFKMEFSQVCLKPYSVIITKH